MSNDQSEVVLPLNEARLINQIRVRIRGKGAYVGWKADMDFLLNEVSRLQSSLAAAEERERWIPVTERLPQNPPGKYWEYYFVGRYVGNDFRTAIMGFHVSRDWADKEAWTHWRPIPIAPLQEKPE